MGGGGVDDGGGEPRRRRAGPDEGEAVEHPLLAELVGATAGLGDPVGDEDQRIYRSQVDGDIGERRVVDHAEQRTLRLDHGG